MLTKEDRLEYRILRLETACVAVVKSINDALSDDPMSDWKDSLEDGADLLNHLLEQREG